MGLIAPLATQIASRLCCQQQLRDSYCRRRGSSEPTLLVIVPVKAGIRTDIQQDDAQPSSRKQAQLVGSNILCEEEKGRKNISSRLNTFLRFQSTLQLTEWNRHIDRRRRHTSSGGGPAPTLSQPPASLAASAPSLTACSANRRAPLAMVAGLWAPPPCFLAVQAAVAAAVRLNIRLGWQRGRGRKRANCHRVVAAAGDAPPHL